MFSNTGLKTITIKWKKKINEFMPVPKITARSTGTVKNAIKNFRDFSTTFEIARIKKGLTK